MTFNNDQSNSFTGNWRQNTQLNRRIRNKWTTLDYYVAYRGSQKMARLRTIGNKQTSWKTYTAAERPWHWSVPQSIQAR